MTQNKQRHAIYVSVKRQHPDWPPELIKKEVDKLEGSHNGSQRFTKGSQVHISGKPENSEDELVINQKGSHNGSQRFTKSSQGSQPRIKYMLSYSRNKYQFVLYSLDHEGKKNLIRSCKKNDILKLGPCEIVLTWGPDIEEALK